MGETTERTAEERVAGLLERLADGGEVVLGEFADNGAAQDPAGEEAAVLRDLAEALRTRGPQLWLLIGLRAA